MGRHTLRGLRIVQTEYGVRGAAGLERASLLKILAFEEELGARELIDDARGKDRRSVDVRLDALMRDQHVRKRRDVHRGQLLTLRPGSSAAAVLRLCSWAAATPESSLMPRPTITL